MTFEDIKKFIESSSEFSHYTGGVDDSRIVEVEQLLGVTLPADYKDFLRSYGHGATYGVELVGVGLGERAAVVKLNERFRELGLPRQLVAIQNCDEWLYCLDTSKCKDGFCPVVSWDQFGDEYTQVYDSFLDFVISEFQEAKEDW